MTITLSPDLERLVAEQVESGRYTSADEVIREGLELLKSKGTDASANLSTGMPAFVEAIVAIGKSVPDSEWAKVPTDLAANFEHYAHGSPKQS